MVIAIRPPRFEDERFGPACATYLRPPKRGLRVGGSRFGEGRSKVLQENHPCGPGSISCPAVPPRIAHRLYCNTVSSHSSFCHGWTSTILFGISPNISG